MDIESELYSLQEIVNQEESWCFNVPIYQRLYVWGDDQIDTLLTDIANAYDRGETQFFLGGALLVEKTGIQDQEKGRRRFDLIDGQQRFTTLWLLSTIEIWREIMGQFIGVKFKDEKTPRLKFSIRRQVNSYMESLLSDAKADARDTPDTLSMRHAQQLMQSFAATHERANGQDVNDDYLRGLADFVYRKVKLVLTRVPEGMDLNKLFEVINNRGIQLQHHEILKARLLKDIPAEDQGRYAALWSACADMSGFVERNLCAETRLEAHQLGELYRTGKLAEAEAVHALLHQMERSVVDNTDLKILTLERILDSPSLTVENEAREEPINDDPPWARSIIGFPLFLQHVLRIWLHQHDKPDLVRLLDRQLLALFDNAFFGEEDYLTRGEHACQFIDLLWRMRVLWDEYVIKWVDQGDEEVHQVCLTTLSSSKGNHYVNRSRESPLNSGLSLLQSMLYHSQEITTHYWLTPFLNFIHQQSFQVRGKKEETERIFNYLCHLENHLLSERSGEALVIRTRWFMDEPWRHSSHPILETVFEESLGVRFPHYWFYKLDFVLWYEQREDHPLWSNFRFTAKNSVEHISPQSPQGTDFNTVSPLWMNRFGNLALVSRSINSEYSNLPYNEKRQRYLNKRDLEKRPDSLKMDLIYAHPAWGDEYAKAHQESIIQTMRSYYSRSFNPDFQE